MVKCKENECKIEKIKLKLKQIKYKNLILGKE